MLSGTACISGVAWDWATVGAPGVSTEGCPLGESTACWGIPFNSGSPSFSLSRSLPLAPPLSLKPTAAHSQQQHTSYLNSARSLAVAHKPLKRLYKKTGIPFCLEAVGENCSKGGPGLQVGCWRHSWISLPSKGMQNVRNGTRAKPVGGRLCAAISCIRHN